MSQPSARSQLPLAIQLRDDATLANFLVRPALEPVVAALRQQMEPQGEPYIYLYGPAGSGKSHLLQACCHAPEVQAQYLPLSDLGGFEPTEVLQGLAGLHLVCLDELQAVAGNAPWEAALFNFYNEVRESDCRLLVAADAPPRGLGLVLEDLRSRLSHGVVYQLQQAGDEEKAAILSFRAQRRGMSLPGSVATYIVSRAPRAMHDLLVLLDELDRASLVQKRALSIPFVREVLGW